MGLDDALPITLSFGVLRIFNVQKGYGRELVDDVEDNKSSHSDQWPCDDICAS